jgi:uncharacterized membrane protein YhhN
VNAVSITALVVAAVFALGDWWSRARDVRALEYVCKPATMLALIVVATTLDPAGGQSARRWWFVAALVFSLAGDVFLMLPRDLFVPGLAAFLVGHVCYVVGFWTNPPDAVAFVISVGVVVIAVAPVATRLLRALTTQPEFRVPVACYMIVISTMVASALASTIVIAAVGAILFAISDSLIAWDRFVRALAWSGVAIMVTYHLAQALLTLSLLTR